MQIGGDSSELQSQSQAKKLQIDEASKEVRRSENRRDMAIAAIGNYVHDSVPVSNDEASLSRDKSPKPFSYKIMNLSSKEQLFQ